jgi:enamine deaminase RidA (YjgF/YER057c/UK114 family)
MREIHPEGWQAGPGFSWAFASEGEQVAVLSGCIGNDPRTGAMVAGGMVEQTAQALRNIVELAEAAGSDAAQIMFLRLYVTDRQAYMDNLRPIGRAFREILGGHYPAMTFLAITGLFSPDALIEIDGVAAIPRA